MNKGFIYYFVLASLLFHLLLLLGLKHIPWQQAMLVPKEDNQPIAIDLVGPLKQGKQTQIPIFPEKPPEKGPAVVNAEPRKDAPKEPLMTARAAPQRQVAPSVPPAPPVKDAPPPAPAPAPAPKAQTPAPDEQARPEPPARTPAETPDGAVAAPGKAASAPDKLARATPSPGTQRTAPGGMPAIPGTPGTGEPQRRLVQPSVEDLMRYARVDKDIKRVEPEQGITLDTTDLMYTSYLQGLRRRIEMVWKYPDIAQSDGLQGELVMRFSIEKSGKVEAIELLKSSGYPVLDRAAEKALSDASPFNPLPDSWEKERFVITGTFIYKLYGLYMR